MNRRLLVPYHYGSRQKPSNFFHNIYHDRHKKISLAEKWNHPRIGVLRLMATTLSKSPGWSRTTTTPTLCWPTVQRWRIGGAIKWSNTIDPPASLLQVDGRARNRTAHSYPEKRRLNSLRFMCNLKAPFSFHDYQVLNRQHLQLLFVSSHRSPFPVCTCKAVSPALIQSISQWEVVDTVS